MGTEDKLPKLTHKDFRKYKREKAQEIDIQNEEDEDQLVVTLLNKNKETIQDLVEVTEILQEERRQKGEKDTLYHLEDEEELDDYLEDVEEKESAELVNLFKGIYDDVAIHVKVNTSQ